MNVQQVAGHVAIQKSLTERHGSKPFGIAGSTTKSCRMRKGPGPRGSRRPSRRVLDDVDHRRREKTGCRPTSTGVSVRSRTRLIEPLTSLSTWRAWGIRVRRRSAARSGESSRRETHRVPRPGFIQLWGGEQIRPLRQSAAPAGDPVGGSSLSINQPAPGSCHRQENATFEGSSMSQRVTDGRAPVSAAIVAES